MNWSFYEYFNPEIYRFQNDDQRQNMNKIMQTALGMYF